MTMKTILGAIVLVLCAAAGGIASAADKTFYIGIGLGQSRPNFDTVGASSNITGVNIGGNFDSTDGANKIYAGYNFHQYFSVEGTWINLGSYTSNTSQQVEMAGWGLSLVGHMPLRNDISLLGRIGENRMRLKRNQSNPIAISTADNSWSPSLGIGLKFDFNPNFSARAEFERITKMGSNTTTIRTDANVYTIGVGYTF
jgi:opacity protein-like surface antigen